MSELLNFDGNFEGLDLNVGDKVRIVRKSGVEVIGTITELNDSNLTLNNDLTIWSSVVITIEVIERAPKALPTEPGYYSGNLGSLYLLRGMTDTWYFVSRDGWEKRTGDQMRMVRNVSGLKRLIEED